MGSSPVRGNWSQDTRDVPATVLRLRILKWKRSQTWIHTNARQKVFIQAFAKEYNLIADRERGPFLNPGETLAKVSKKKGDPVRYKEIHVRTLKCQARKRNGRKSRELQVLDFI